jgi:lytic cellulose monooxygenase (C1-hydroxylating)
MFEEIRVAIQSHAQYYCHTLSYGEVDHIEVSSSSAGSNARKISLLSLEITWTVTIPSDIKPGKYVMRHELIALHFCFSGNPKGSGTPSSGAQLYPICFNVEVTGTGKAEPEDVTFPGGYKPNDPGILNNIYYGPNAYVSA